jgi:hypothetical protein
MAGRYHTTQELLLPLLLLDVALLRLVLGAVLVLDVSFRLLLAMLASTAALCCSSAAAG